MTVKKGEGVSSETISLLVASYNITSCWKFLGSKADDGPGSVSLVLVSRNRNYASR